MFSNEMKYAYLEKRFIIPELQPGNHTFRVECELCSKTQTVEIYCTGNFRVQKLQTNGHFHHKDGNPKHDEIDNIRFLCKRCHRLLHRLGQVLRWLEEINKAISDFPEAKDLKSIRFF